MYKLYHPTLRINRHRSRRVLTWQIKLRRRKLHRDIIQTPRLTIILVPINPQPQLPGLSIHDPPHTISAAEWLMDLQTMP